MNQKANNMNRDDRVRQLTPLMLGNMAAVEFLVSVIEVLHVWDDLIDHDQPVSDTTINNAFYALLVTIPSNPFYRQNFDRLNPILVNAITNWHIANRMERVGDAYQHSISFILRSSYVDLTTQAAVIVGGLEHGAEVGYHNRLFAHKETLDGYLENLAIEFALRNKNLHKE